MQRSGGSQRGHPTDVRFESPFLTGERVQSVKMNFFIEKTGNNISKEVLNFTLRSIKK